jgi:hypothetical protein
VSLDLVDEDGASHHHVSGGDPLRAIARFDHAGAAAVRIVVGSGFVPTVYERAMEIPSGSTRAVIEMDGRLLSGTYTLTAMVLDAGGATLGASAPLPFFVDASRRAFGVADLDLRMRVGQQDIDLQPISYAKRS